MDNGDGGNSDSNNDREGNEDEDEDEDSEVLKVACEKASQLVIDLEDEDGIQLSGEALPALLDLLNDNPTLDLLSHIQGPAPATPTVVQRKKTFDVPEVLAW